MAYCVNCGVELAPEAERCPLCLTPLPGAAPGTRVLVRRPAAPDRGIIRRLLESRLLRLGTATGGNEQ